MKRTPLQMVLLTLLATSLVTCGRKEANPAAPVQASEAKPKADAKKANPPDDAPKVVDPIKDGY